MSWCSSAHITSLGAASQPEEGARQGSWCMLWPPSSWPGSEGGIHREASRVCFPGKEDSSCLVRFFPPQGCIWSPSPAACQGNVWAPQQRCHSKGRASASPTWALPSPGARLGPAPQLTWARGAGEPWWPSRFPPCTLLSPLLFRKTRKGARSGGPFFPYSSGNNPSSPVLDPWSLRGPCSLSADPHVT